MKAVLRGKFISWSAFNKRSKTQQINDIILQLKALEKKNRPKPKVVEDMKQVNSELKSTKLKQKKQYKKLTKYIVGSSTN